MKNYLGLDCVHNKLAYSLLHITCVFKCEKLSDLQLWFLFVTVQ
jgi:hypothetical protein